MPQFFDKFRNKSRAFKFVEALHAEGVRADLWESEEELFAGARRGIHAGIQGWDPLTGKCCDLFIYDLHPPIVCVERSYDLRREDEVEFLGKAFGGKYRGV